eukprot:7160475-Pyramimonas_sp.AAC.1
MDPVVAGAAIGRSTNLKNPSDHVPVMDTIAPKPRAADGPSPGSWLGPYHGRVHEVSGWADRKYRSEPPDSVAAR